MSGSGTLFDEVVEASGLVELIAPFAVSRMLIAAGVASPRELTRDELATALPELERGLSTYLRGVELDRSVAALGRLAA